MSSCGGPLRMAQSDLRSAYAQITASVLLSLRIREIQS